jgi:hypothetical protein
MTDEKHVIDWQAFAARVPAGTFVKRDQWCGVLMESKNYRSDDAYTYVRAHLGSEDFEQIYNDTILSKRDEEYVSYQFFAATGLTTMHPSEVHYLINGQWLTFDQVMALPLP